MHIPLHTYPYECNPKHTGSNAALTHQIAETIRNHQQTYSQGADNLDSNSLGSAAALQALKKFTQGETGGNQSQGAFLGLALSEASKVSLLTKHTIASTCLLTL